MKSGILINTIHGLKWTSIAHLVRQIIQYISTIVLVGLISPEDFGLMAMAVIVIGFLDIFKDLGLSSAIIQRDNPTKELISSIYWLNLLFGIVISAAIYLSAPLIAELYESLKVRAILEILALTFTISGFSILQKAIFEKELKFQLLARIELISSIAGFATAITFAILGYGVWSLVYQTLVNASITTLLLLFYSKWKPVLLFNLTEIKMVANYSLNLIGFNVINYFARNSDYFLIGKYLGDRELGHYYLAYRLMLYPIQNISAVVSRVLFPTFSIIKNDNVKFRNAYINITNIIALITFPMMIGLALVSFSFTDVFFKSEWDSILIAKLIIILAPIGAAQSVISTVGNIYQAKGKTDWMFRWSLFYTSIIVLGFVIGLKWGVIGVAISYLLTNLLTLYPAFAIPFKLIKMQILKFFESFKSTVFSVAIMSLTVFTISILTDSIDNPKLRLVVMILSGIISYFVASLTINREKLYNIKTIFVEYLKASNKS